ncbi:beta-amyrin 6-beta-monooxygenase-like [Salvia miltiorrhiza]|uniref:beta-amyrin 6-beta-monooxygenase-like n=1 Tax=Salvia miltiorrhiza TaxID=226208 RepID=UPI0025ABEFFC|nr:beta-amyrin 6-beta-monooxygenase-like [Salvia miltiorrhiza]
MDIFIPYLFFLLLLPFSLYLILFFHKDDSDDASNLPPGSKGWPILGENVDLGLLGLSKFVRDRMEKYSHDVFQTSLLGEKVMIFCGAQGNKIIFTSDVAPWLPLSLQKVLLPDALAMFRNFQYDTLKPEALRQYIPVMDEMARGQLAGGGWRPNSVVKAQPLINKYTFELSCRLFLNLVDPERLRKLSDPFAKMRNGLLSLPIDLPGTAFHRAIKAGNMVRGEMLSIVGARRKEMNMMVEENKGGEGRDLLSKMLLLTDEDGKPVSDKKIANCFVSLLLASYDSTAAALTSVVYFLAQLPHVYELVLKEQMAIAKSKAPGELLTWQDVENMKYSWNVARETLRLVPPSPGTFREATTDITFAGYTIPTGMKALWTPHSSHSNPDYFPEPDKFDPSRFDGSGPPPYTFVPFGGGPRMCPGRVYAKLAILVLMHNLVTSFRLERAIPHEKMVLQVAPLPTHGLQLYLKPHYPNSSPASH